MIPKTIKPFVTRTYYKMEKSNFGRKVINRAFIFQKSNRKYSNIKDASLFTIKNINNVYSPNTNLNQGAQIKDLFQNISVTIPNDGFIYTLDELKNIIHENKLIDNISIDYSRILKSSLNDIKSKYTSLEIKNHDYLENQIKLIEGIELLIDREVDELNKSQREDKNKFSTYLNNIKTKEVSDNFEEALQRILFFNQLCWQTGHELNGLGRLDKILEPVYNNDKTISKEDALYLIKSFLKTLHQYYWYKSRAMMGDTGQVIILGGKEDDGSYFYNDLTSLFIQANMELNLPDPKILLRVSENTPRFLMEESLKSMSTGIGSPLISNDELVIPKLIDFGYDSKDAYNYVVSACWEPAPIGKGMEVNNVLAMIFLKPLNELLSTEDLNLFNNFEDLLEVYKKYLKDYINSLIMELNNIKWEEDPLLSLFIDNCDERQLDISKGGAKYSNMGVTSVSLGNTINSLMNIKKLVFTDEKYSLIDLNTARENNFNDNPELLFDLKNQNLRFGIDDDEVIQLTNEITKFASDIFKQEKTSLGGKFKFGLSAPSYISEAEQMSASLDGRKDFEAFNVHISSESDKQDYTELMRFASKLDYSDSRFNGNVADFMLTPNFIQDNFDKFLDFLLLSIKLGFFQMQMNVVSSDTLIKAKADPEKYPNLIVRVWGFSAYFNELPLSYKDVLIKRALKNEGKI